MIITSSSNEQIKNIIQLKEKSKVRKQKKQFVVEGVKMFSEVPKEDLKYVYVTEEFEKKNKISLINTDYYMVSDSLFKKISDTINPQGVLAIVKQKEYSIDEILNNRNKEKSCIVVLDRLQDPGNLGTIIRTGEGAGITAVVMSSDCADIYNPKVIRSTMGSIFRVPFVIADDLVSIIEKIKHRGVVTYAAHLKGVEYKKGVFQKDIALLIGNEAKGLSAEVLNTADKLVKIPMEGKVESLNASVAASILMYEALYR